MLRKKWRKWMFSAIFLLIVAFLFCVSTVAATTVKPISGVEVTDSVGTGKLSGETVTITATGGYTSRTTNTVTITNASESTATLSFNYSVTGNYNSYTTPSGNKSGTYTETLPAGGTVEIKIESKALKMTATLTLSNFSLTATAASSTVGFAYDTTLGSVTVDGAGVANGASTEINGTTGAALVATPVSGATFVGWIDASNNKLISTSATYTLIPAENMSVQAAFSNASANAWFLVPDGSDKYLYNLNAACTKASSTSDKTVILAANGTLPSGNYTIPAGVTLLIPFDAANTVYTTTPGTTGGSFVTPTAYRTLTMASGANLTVNGSLSLSGTVSARKDFNGRPHGPLGYIKMNSGSSITVNSGANLYAWGYIYGDGNVEVKSGATVYECFQVTDYRGGDVTSTMQNNKQKVFPMSQYYVQNIEVPMKLHVGAKENCFFAVDVSVVGVQTAVVPFVGGSGEKVMFQITNGYLGKSYDENTDRLVVDIYGDVTVAPYSFSIKVGLLGSVTMDSSKYVLPLTQNLTVNVKNGKTLTISQDIALLPEAELNIEQGANCTITDDKKIIVYDIDDWGGYCDTANKTHDVLPYAPGRPTPGTSVRESLTKDASILVNGTLDASKGYIYTTTHGANIYSTEAGEIKLRAGTEKIVYQVTTKSSDISGWPEIDITPAKLKHANGEYLTTADATAATTYNYNVAHGYWYAGTHGETTATTPPTCTENGYTNHSCPCGYEKQDAVVDALGHDVCWSPSGKTHTLTCSRGDLGSTVVDVTYRLKDYLWLNATVTKNELGATWTLSGAQYQGSYIIRAVGAAEIPNSLSLVVTYGGVEYSLEVNLAAYQDMISDAEDKALIDKLLAYGAAAKDYFDGNETLENGHVVTGNPADSNNTVSTTGNPVAWNGATLETTGANIYFDEALRLGISYNLSKIPDGYSIAQIGLLVGDYGIENLILDNASKAYLMYDLLNGKTVDGVVINNEALSGVSSNNRPWDKDGNVINVTPEAWQEPDNLTAGTIIFDFAAQDYKTMFAIRPVIVFEKDGTYVCVYGRQIGYGLEAYINGVYAEASDEYKYLLEMTWALAGAASPVTGG